MKTPIKSAEDFYMEKRGDLLRSNLGTKDFTIDVMKQYAEYCLTKEKEQREELIKDVCIYSIATSNLCSYDKAEQYYNEVIKPKYKVK